MGNADPNCPVCNVGSMAFLFESEGFHFDKCLLCGYVKRREPASATFQQYESGEYQDERYAENQDDYRAIYGMLLDECGKWSDKKGKLLDIGCSLGLLLDEARKRGWEPWGVEISELGVKQCAALGLGNVRQCDIHEVEYPAGSFDLIVMNHVLEHIDAPVSYIRKISKWLAPRGVLCIGVPNYASSSARKDGPRWSGLRPFEHISQFSPKTLKMTVQSAGCFDIVNISGNHGYGIPPKRLIKKFNYYLTLLKDRLLLSRSMILIAKKRMR